MVLIENPGILLFGGTSTNVEHLIGLGIGITIAVWILSSIIDRITKKYGKGKRMNKYIAAELKKVLSDVTPKLMIMSEADVERARSPEQWSRKQILGHLIDSASNNHQRFVRAQMSSELRIAEYEGDNWVITQNYQNENWLNLVHLWNSYNLHLAHIISHIPDQSLRRTCFIGENEPVTLEFLIQDYLQHLRHHVDQILAGW